MRRIYLFLFFWVVALLQTKVAENKKCTSVKISVKNIFFADQ